MNAPVLRGDHCQCAPCGQYFKTTDAFDKHRRGKHGWASTRRCLDVAGMQKAGLVREDGEWRVWKPTPESTLPENTPVISAKKQGSAKWQPEILAGVTT